MVDCLTLNREHKLREENAHRVFGRSRSGNRLDPADLRLGGPAPLQPQFPKRHGYRYAVLEKPDRCRADMHYMILRYVLYDR